MPAANCPGLLQPACTAYADTVRISDTRTTWHIVEQFETRRAGVRRRVVTLTVNRPQALNALSELKSSELQMFLERLSSSDGFVARGIILTGAGEKAFVAGVNIREMGAMDPVAAQAYGQLGQRVTTLLEQLPVPVIACVSGYALGGGCELAMGCDFIYATERAVFGQPEVSLGLIPGFGGCVRLQRRVGQAGQGS
ncbi:enoyl-CoA hydratase-related protein [Kribbella sp. NPDC051137]|uniref:enoyl-CoA hydratase-related protein n=1 Tax=Kribbella sp. NPDC051137 TaxID=3155045 RepID=UPI00342D0E52